MSQTYKVDPDQSITGEILTVSALNSAAKHLLEGRFPMVWVEGEISNFSVPSSGHWYFSVKDQMAQVRCAMFKGANRIISTAPSNGMKVIIRAKVSLYEGRGDFQLIVESMELAGEGALRLAYEALKRKLNQLGWFDMAHKKPIPEFPSTIGVITSPTGAAIRDILSVLKRRYPVARILIYPTPVQGNEAIMGVSAAILRANQHKQADVLLVARGGGSLEDLWAFNEERVVFEIFKSKIPIVTGVGHETDTTIADYVSDRRAPTPSAAAELVTPNLEDIVSTIHYHQQRLQAILNQYLWQRMQHVDHLQKRLIHPKQRISTLKDQLRQLTIRANKATLFTLKKHEHSLIQTKQRFLEHSPQNQLKRLSTLLKQYTTSVILHMRFKLKEERVKLQGKAHQLHLVSPLATLERGYTIVKDKQNNLIKQVTQLKVDDSIQITFQDGAAKAKIIECIK